MKKKLLHIALATALLPVFTGCIGNFEEYNTLQNCLYIL